MHDRRDNISFALQGALAERPNLWDVVVERMDDDVRESVYFDLAPCTELEFLREYLRRAETDLIIG